MRIWHKILVAPAVAILFLLALGALSWQMLARQGSALDALARTRMTAAQEALELSGQLSQLHSKAYRLVSLVVTLSPEQLKQETDAQHQALETMARRVATLAADTRLTEPERQRLQAAAPHIATYRKMVDAALEVATLGSSMGAMSMQTADAFYQDFLKELGALVALEKQLAQDSYLDAAAAAQTARKVLAGVVALAAIAALAIALAMSRAIVRPLHAAIATAGQVARGDLTVTVRPTGRDETADLLRALAAMSAQLRGLVQEVADGARRVADTSAQIALGNQELSQRTETQASTLEETASSMEELTSIVSQNAQHAREASQLAVGASDVARRGGDVVGNVVTTMHGIAESARRIAEIIGVIDGIAFQTNILALNAAVEAARAGEQGRGFAVVAGEVRNLAQRSAAAAREIKQLIGESAGKVDAGARLVDDAGRTMREVVAAVKQVSDLIAEIAAASEEQDAGIQQVNSAVVQMDGVVQQNASLVEEAAAATEAMKAEAATLLQQVARFRLDGAGAGTGRAAAAPAAAATPAARSPAPRPTEVAALPLRPAPVLAPAVAAGPGGDWKEF